MSALFDDILRRRNEIEQEEQLRLRNRYQQFYRRERSQLARAEARRELDRDTVQVLTAFCQGAYPSMRVRTYEQGWSLGRWARARDNSLVWESILDITLRYDNQEQAVSYDCRGHNRHMAASLTPGALRQTLLRIYRPQQANTGPAAKKR